MGRRQTQRSRKDLWLVWELTRNACTFDNIGKLARRRRAIPLSVVLDAHPTVGLHIGRGNSSDYVECPKIWRLKFRGPRFILPLRDVEQPLRYRSSSSKARFLCDRTPPRNRLVQTSYISYTQGLPHTGVMIGWLSIQSGSS